MSVWWRKEWVRFEAAWSALEGAPVEDRLGDDGLAALRVAAADPAVRELVARVRDLESQVRVCAERLEDGGRALAACASDLRDAAAGPDLACGFVDLELLLGDGAQRIAAASAHAAAVEGELGTVARETGAAWQELRRVVDAAVGGDGVFAAITADVDRAMVVLVLAARLRTKAMSAGEEGLRALPDIAERELTARRQRLRALRRLDQTLVVLESTHAWTMNAQGTRASSTPAPGCDSLATWPPSASRRSG